MFYFCFYLLHHTTPLCRIFPTMEHTFKKKIGKKLCGKHFEILSTTHIHNPTVHYSLNSIVLKLNSFGSILYVPVIWYTSTELTKNNRLMDWPAPANTKPDQFHRTQPTLAYSLNNTLTRKINLKKNTLYFCLFHEMWREKKVFYYNSPNIKFFFCFIFVFVY